MGVLVMRYPAEELWELAGDEQFSKDEGVCVLTDSHVLRILHYSEPLAEAIRLDASFIRLFQNGAIQKVQQKYT